MPPSLSDGTLRFICLAALFCSPLAYRPSVIIVDEPELGLHPYAITMLANLIKGRRNRNADHCFDSNPPCFWIIFSRKTCSWRNSSKERRH